MHWGQTERGAPLSPAVMRPQNLSTEHAIADMFVRATARGECIETKIPCSKNGYPMTSVPGMFNGRSVSMHRFSAWLFHGLPPPGAQVVRHLCGNPRCIRPEHLKYGTFSENRQDFEVHRLGAWAL